MADAPDNQTEAGTTTANTVTARSALLKRNPHLRDNQAASPFGPLGTRQLLQKQLMTPGSATSASSFEEGASNDGYSDFGTPSSEDGLVGGQQAGLHVKPETTQVVTRMVSKQPTKRLSSPSRESLARRLMGSSTKSHGMLPDEESATKVDLMETELPPSEMLSNLVVKPVPTPLAVGGASSTATTTKMVSLSPQSTKVTRRIVASPRKTMRRVVVRRTGADGKVHEEVQYVDADGQIVQQAGSFFNSQGGDAETSTTSSGRTTVTRRISTPGKTLRRVLVRRTGADGQVHEEVQFMDADGNVVEGEATEASSSSATVSTPSRSTVTRRIVTPAKLTRRILRRTGADGQVHEQVQFLDAEGNVVRTEGDDGSTWRSSGTVTTRRTVTPGKTIRRVLVRRTGADGQVREEVQFMDADGNVVQSDGGELVKTSSFTSGSGSDAPGSSSGRTVVTRRIVSPRQTVRRVLIRRRGADGEVREEEQYVDADGNVVSSDGGELAKSGSFTTQETSTNEGSSDTPGRRTVTRRVIRRMLVRKDGTRVPIEQYVDSDGQVIEGEGGSLVSAGSFTGSVGSVDSDTSSGTSSRRTITRRVVSSPVRRTVVHKAGSSSGAESEEDVQYLESEGGALSKSGSFTRTVTTQSTPGRRVITRRVVTPQRVVRRMVVRKGAPGSGDVDGLDIDAELVQSEGSSDESVGGSSRGGSSRGGYVSDRIVIPGNETRRVASRTVVASNQTLEGVDDDVGSESERLSSRPTVATSKSEVTTPTRVGVAVVTEPQEGEATPEATQKIGLTPGVIWDYFTKSEDDDEPTSRSEETVETHQSVVPSEEEEDKSPVPTSGFSTRASTATALPADERDPSRVLGAAPIVAAAVVASTIVDDSTSPDQDVEVAVPEEGAFTVCSVDEPVQQSTEAAAPEEEGEEPRAAGGFWNFFGKSEDKPSDSPSSGKAASSTSEEPAQVVPPEREEPFDAPATILVATQSVDEVQQHLPDAEDDDFMTPEASFTIDGVPETEDVQAPARVEVAQPSDLERPSDGSDSPDVAASTESVEYAMLPAVSPSTSTAATATTETAPEVPRERRNSGGGFWGLFGKPDVSEAPAKELEDAAHPVSLTDSVASAPEDVDAVTEPTATATAHESSVVPSDVEDKAPAAQLEAVAPDAEVDSPRSDSPLPAGAALVTAAVHGLSNADRDASSKAAAPASEELKVEEKPITDTVQPSSESPRHGRRSSGGFWGFFGKSEEEPKNETAPVVAEAATSAPASEETPKTVVETSDVLPASPTRQVDARTLAQEVEQQVPAYEAVRDINTATPSATVVIPGADESVFSTSTIEEHATEAPRAVHVESHKSPRGEVALPAVEGATAAIVTAAALTASEPERQQPEESSGVKPIHDATLEESSAPAVVVTTTATREEGEEESRGGFWGFFGNQEAKKTQSDALTTTHAVSEVQQDLPASREGEAEEPATATFYQTSASDEDKAPAPTVEIVGGEVTDVPQPRSAPESPVSTKSPRERDVLRAAAVAGAAGVATAAVVKALDTKKPETDAAIYRPSRSSGEMPVEEEELATAAVAASTGPNPIKTTALPMEETESPSKVPHRKPGRSIWTFWGGDKPKSPLSDDEKPKDEASVIAAVPAATATREEPASIVEASHHTPVPSAGEARQFWHQKDQQNPDQISYAAKEGATYGPESKFEPMPATTKIRSPVARGQGAVVESPRATEAGRPTAHTPVGGLVVTEITQTTVEVEEEAFETAPLHHAAAVPAIGVATADDIAVVSESQHSIERESVERDDCKDDKPARAGGFWGFLGKKDKPEEPAVGAFDNSGVERVSWEIEGEEGKLPRGSLQQEEKAAAVQLESARRSIPSDATPTHAVAPVVASGKPVRDSERRTTELIDGVEPDVELDEHYVEIASPRHGERPVNDGGAWAVKPCSLAWSNLRLARKDWKNAPAGSLPSGGNGAVLDDVSGAVNAREFLVITGPSKGESLALLSCLAGYEDAMEGNVTVNGRAWNEKMNRYVAYVMREDLFYETLTVHEHLVVQAQLRMRRTHSAEMCLQRVERVIEDVGLSSCRDKLIGGGISLRGITRGERKLLAIATALLTNPSILLVEEPTDGLDTFSAEKIVAKLRWLAFEKGLTVAVTLHHPSSHFYGLFDVLYLVADASCVYDGKASNGVAFFSSIGFQCPGYMSPMDYFMLQMVVGDREADDEGVARVETLKREWSQRSAAVYAENAARAAAASEDAVVDDYDQKNRYYHMGCCGQLWLLWARHVRRLSRYGFVFWWHLPAALLIGVVVGLVYLQLDLDDQQGIQNFAGAFFYAVVVQMLFMAYRTFVFMPRETAIALRERQEYRGGWYHLLCWYCTKIVAELPALIVLSIALFVPLFLLVGIGHGFKVYVYMQIAMVLAGWAAIGLAFLTLGLVRHVTLALMVYAVLLALFVAFGGLLINVTDIPDWLVWLHYISPVKYAYEAMMKIFWKRVDAIDCDWTVEGCVALTGDGVLKYYSMENRSALGDSLLLLAIGFALFLVAFWLLLAMASKRVSGLQWRYNWRFKGKLGSRQQRVGKASATEKYAATRSSVRRVIERKSYHSSSAAVERSAVNYSDNYYIQVETPRAGGAGVCDAPAVTLGWSSLWLKAPSAKKINGETQKQPYWLSDASGSAKCGELVLVTGPSDDANVALLESLGGQQKRLKGKVTLNGVVSAASKVSERAAYVARDDLFYETLTVEEHLRFQAQLVLGKAPAGCGLCCGAGAGHLETERVEMVLDELELAAKRHVLIRYLSSSDTKLLAIATALVSNPSILLAEEPTAGMDFYSSQRVVLKLRQLARGGRTVVVAMHHPSSHLYALFDTLYLLAGGVAVYHGKVREAVPYFASLGYQCPQYMSPVDYFIRQVSVSGNANETTNGQATLFKEAWSTRYSELCLADNEETETQGGAAASRRSVGCCGQLSLLFRRHLLRLARYRAVFGWHALWSLVLGVVFGLIFLQLDLDDQQDIQNWAGAFFFVVVLQMLVVAYRTFVFLPREMTIAEREHRSGRYYMICWYLTKVFAELPAMLVLSVLLFVPAYLLIGIGHGFKLYFYMQIVMWLAGWSAAGLASLLLGLFRRVRVALVVYMLLLILFVVFGGLLVNVDDVPDYLVWLHYISPVKYGYEALMKLFWGRIVFLACGESDGSGSGSATFTTVGDDGSFSMSGSGSFEDDDGCIAHSGEEVLAHYSMDESRDARSDSIILLELTVLYFVIGYAFLSLRWRRYKTRQQRLSTQNAIDN